MKFPSDDEWIAGCAMTLRDMPSLGLGSQGAAARAGALCANARWRGMGPVRAAILWAMENGGGAEAHAAWEPRIKWIMAFIGLYQDHPNFCQDLAGDDVEEIACLESDDPALYALSPADAVQAALGKQ